MRAKLAVSFFGPEAVYICILPLYPGSSKSTIALLVVGFVTLFAGVVNEAYTKRSPIIPPRLFRVSYTLIHIKHLRN